MENSYPCVRTLTYRFFLVFNSNLPNLLGIKGFVVVAAAAVVINGQSSMPVTMSVSTLMHY
jgi:hypothetical protein